MEKLINWTARRAGGRITLTGVGADGRPRKIVGIVSIDGPCEALPDRKLITVAVHSDGRRFRLL